ncbi:MAG: ribose transport system ATP-binding protein, partial [Pseudonocardiales bacterium]|nr:ribose transport system ATP-binding protein [Pseudonocardiales bacterium]
MTFIAEKIVKVFPGVRALDHATLRLEPGAIHALLGENGAGKSTLIKVVTGVYKPDGGRLLTTAGDGTMTELNFSGPLDAQRTGIGVVHQERNLVPAFSVAENIALQAVPKRHGFVDRDAMRNLARQCLDRLDVQLDVDRTVGALSVAQMQLVEIAKALAVDSTVLLLDEPTASLTGDEAERLYTVVRSLRDQGHSVVLVSHRLEEVFAVADTVTVLRDGRSVAEAEPLAAHTRDDVVTLMVGRALAD